jgi:hypothetical protein
MFGWHPRLAIDAFFGIEHQHQPKFRKSYVDKLKKRKEFAYKTAKETFIKQGQGHKTYYDVLVRHSISDVGDRVLIRNVTSKGKLDDKWEKQPFIIVGIPNDDIAVYKLTLTMRHRMKRRFQSQKPDQNRGNRL